MQEDQTNRPGYEYLSAYQLGKVIQDLTVIFCDRFISKKSRTHDQMIQAARSNSQNVAEGYTAESLKSYIFLTGVAHGSNEELTKIFFAKETCQFGIKMIQELGYLGILGLLG